MSLAEAIVDRLAGLGVKRMFGVPGGGLDLIEAAAAVGINFVLTRGETSAALMAVVTGELTRTPGVALTGIGPGAASAANGVAYASLEREPMLLFTDGRAIGPDKSPHQVFDQPALFRPITKDCGALRPVNGRARFDEMIAAALSSPMGPVQIDLSSVDSAIPVDDAASPQAAAGGETKLSEAAMSAALAMIGRSRRPVIVAGLEARATAAAVALARLAQALGCAVLTSYKAKGAFPDSDPQCVGHFTGAEAERPCLAEAAPVGCRLTVDAGAHMFSTMAQWCAESRLTCLNRTVCRAWVSPCRRRLPRPWRRRSDRLRWSPATAV